MMKKIRNNSDTMPVALRDNREYATKANRKTSTQQTFAENSFALIELKGKIYSILNLSYSNREKEILCNAGRHGPFSSEYIEHM